MAAAAAPSGAGGAARRAEVEREKERAARAATGRTARRETEAMASMVLGVWWWTVLLMDIFCSTDIERSEEAETSQNVVSFWRSDPRVSHVARSVA